MPHLKPIFFIKIIPIKLTTLWALGLAVALNTACASNDPAPKSGVEDVRWDAIERMVTLRIPDTGWHFTVAPANRGGKRYSSSNE